MMTLLYDRNALSGDFTSTTLGKPDFLYIKNTMEQFKRENAIHEMACETV